MLRTDNLREIFGYLRSFIAGLMPYSFYCFRCNADGSFSHLDKNCQKCTGDGKDWRNDDEWPWGVDDKSLTLDDLRRKRVLYDKGRQRKVFWEDYIPDDDDRPSSSPSRSSMQAVSAPVKQKKGNLLIWILAIAFDLPPSFRSGDNLRLCLRIGEQHAQVEVHGRADGCDRAGVRS